MTALPKSVLPKSVLPKFALPKFVLSHAPLYRKLLVAVTCVAGALSVYAQHSHSHQLRALALVELYGPPGAGATAKPTGGKLVPIALLVGDKWYDAATYE